MVEGTPLDGEPVGYVLALREMDCMEKRPGLFTRYTGYAQRDQRPSVRTEVQGPLAVWDTSVGINDTTLKKLFPNLDASSVDLADRPEAVPPLSQTVTGDLEKRGLPRPKAAKSPDAGSGPAQAGDVYAVRIRDNVWVTVYCHKVEDRYVYVEYLDGIFSDMPMKAQLKSTVRPRRNGRWQLRASGMDKTTGVRRVARNMPVPETDLPEPEKAPFGNAGDLKRLAGWCFAEL